NGSFWKMLGMAGYRTFEKRFNPSFLMDHSGSRILDKFLMLFVRFNPSFLMDHSGSTFPSSWYGVYPCFNPSFLMDHSG
ncbi:hypothetical protein SAMN04487911_12351, partial [Arenibacter nanhaiticus]